MDTKNYLTSAFSLALVAIVSINMPIAFASNHKISAEKRHIVEHWTPARMANAIPRDLVIDSRGLGYLKKPDGSLQPYGHTVVALKNEAPRGRPSGGSDTEPPSVSNMSPAMNAIIGTDQLFSATITDDSGIKSVSFVITYPNGNTQTFNPASVGNEVWEINLQGFTDGQWSWQVIAKDNASRGGNTGSSESVGFTVDTSGGSGGGGTGGAASYIETNSAWLTGGTVQTAVGRIYFEMPSNPKWKRWAGYVCSGSIATDDTIGRSIIVTAAHCVYDDANKAFARNVLFIPNQAGTTGSGTNKNCDDDPLGCWVPSFGIVDTNWTTTTFPSNKEWDYAYYVVNDIGAHEGEPLVTSALDQESGSLLISFNPPFVDDNDDTETSVDFTHALGYSYSDDPDFMYCAEDMTTEGSVNWWLPSCELSGGSSGGPWIQAMLLDIGSGFIISVNSWGYTTAPGMAGPKFMHSETSAGCLFDKAKNEKFPLSAPQGEQGIIVDSC